MFSGDAFPFHISENCQLIVEKNSLWSKRFSFGSHKRHPSENHIVNSNLIIKGKGFHEIKELVEKPDVYNQMIENPDIDQRKKSVLTHAEFKL